MSTSYIGRARDMVTSLIGKRGELGHVKLVSRYDNCNFYRAEAEVDGYKVFFTVRLAWRDEVRMYAGSLLIAQWLPWSRRSRMTNKANLTKHMLKSLL